MASAGRNRSGDVLDEFLLHVQSADNDAIAHNLERRRVTTFATPICLAICQITCPIKEANALTPTRSSNKAESESWSKSLCNADLKCLRKCTIIKLGLASANMRPPNSNMPSFVKRASLSNRRGSKPIYGLGHLHCTSL